MLLHFCLPTVVLIVTLTQTTCSSVTVSWTPSDNTTTNITIQYNSSVHSGEVDYTEEFLMHHAAKLTGLLPSTRYDITVIAWHKGNTISGFNSTTTEPKGKTKRTMQLYIPQHTYLNAYVMRMRIRYFLLNHPLALWVNLKTVLIDTHILCLY